MSKYVDGFVIPISNEKLVDYRAIAEKAGAIWKEHGALEYIECVGDDLDPGNGAGTFPQMAGTGSDETVLFSWIVYESREHRDAVNKKVMADPRLREMCDPGFDCKRMAFGGFRAIVDL